MGLRKRHWSPPALLAVLALTGCQPNQRDPQKPVPASSQPTVEAGPRRPLIGFGVIAESDPGLTYKGYQPLMDHLTAHAPFSFHIRLGRTSEDLLRSVEERMAELAPLETISYLEAHKQFGAVPLVKPLNRSGEPLSRSVFIAREDSDLSSLDQLKGGSLVLGSHHSTFGNLIPRNELMRAGIDPDDLASIEHVDSADEVVAAVLEGRFDAGAVEDVVAHATEGVRVFHTSEPIPSAPLVIRDDLPQWVAQAIRDALLQLDVSDSAERQAWAEEIRYGFRPAKDSDYEPVRKMVKAVGGQCAGSCHSSVEFSDTSGQ